MAAPLPRYNSTADAGTNYTAPSLSPLTIPTNPRTKEIRVEIEHVKDAMKDNIEKIIQNGEHIGDLMDKSYDLERDATIYQQKTRKLKCHFAKKDVCKILVIVALIIAVTLFLVGIAGGFR